MSEQRDGKLAPARSQELRWLVKNESAFSVKSNGSIEVFRAKKHQYCTCGYRFIFVFNFTSLDQMRSVFPKLGSYGGTKRQAFCNRAFEHIDENMMNRPVIDLSYIDTAVNKAALAWEKMRNVE